MKQSYEVRIINNPEDIILDPEFMRMFPVLDARTSAELEVNILEYGCREPLVLWDGILIDGHNRLGILKKHDLPVKAINMEFLSRDLVLRWMLKNQIERRNLTTIQLTYYRGMHYHVEKRIVSNETGKNQYSEVECQSGTQPPSHSTARELAEKYDVSKRTISRDAQVATALNAIGEASPEIKMDILTGKTHITRRQLKELASGTKEDVSAVISEIEEGTFISRRPAITEAPSAEVRPWEKQFSKMTEEFRFVLKDFAKTDDTASAKTALRQYIEMLEKLYRDMG